MRNMHLLAVGLGLLLLGGTVVEGKSNKKNKHKNSMKRASVSDNRNDRDRDRDHDSDRGHGSDAGHGSSTLNDDDLRDPDRFPSGNAWGLRRNRGESVNDTEFRGRGTARQPRDGDQIRRAGQVWQWDADDDRWEAED